MFEERQHNNVAPPAVEKALGHVLSCRGSQAEIGLPAPIPFGEQRATVGKFVAIQSGASVVVGMIAEVMAADLGQAIALDYRAKARVDLMGEIVRDIHGASRFQRGVREYPAIGDVVDMVRRQDLKLIYSSLGMRSINIGELHQDRSIPAYADVDNLINKHFAVLGSTGVGKSSGVAVILGEIMRARPDVHVLLLDVHNEYGKCFGRQGSVIGSNELKLPFWLLNFDEMIDVVYGGKTAVPEEVEILAELIPTAKSIYLNYKNVTERATLTRRSTRNAGFSPDTPAPYLVSDLLALIDERMGKLENRSSRMSHHRLMMRIEGISNDPRYAFMFENANVGGDTMAAVLNQLFRLEAREAGVTVLKLASLPGEAVDAVVCVAARLAFEFGLWSEGGLPLLLVCEEAHRYVSADHEVGFVPARRALSRIAKEGRKYGVHLGLVTQRPAEIDATIISQCSTLFVMRMANNEDHSIMRSAMSEAAANLLAFVPTLGTGEVVGMGEGMPLAARFSFKTLPVEMLPASEAATVGAKTVDGARSELVRHAIDRWRRATMSPVAGSAGRDAPTRAAATSEADSALARGMQSLKGERPLNTGAQSPYPPFSASSRS